MKHIDKWLIMSITVLVAVLGLSSAYTALASPANQVNPTHEWVNFYGLDTTLDGKPVPAGTIIAAYDAQGTLCGQSVVHTPGYYGLLACYRDDPNTPQDEGAEPGDNITFTMNGTSAAQRGPDGAHWTGNGDLMRVELNAGAASILGGTIRGAVFLDADGDGRYDTGEPPITGVTVTAMSADGFEIPLRSGDDGTFGFVAMRSAYWALEVTVPEGYAASGSSAYTGIWIGEGRWEALDKNFGLSASAPLLLPVTGVQPQVSLWPIAIGCLAAGVGLAMKRVARRRSV